MTDGLPVFNLIVSLLLVLAMIIICLWLMKKMALFNQSPGSNLQVLATMNVGQRERAVLVQAGDKQLLLGVASGHVNTLHVFDTPIVDTDATSAPKGKFSKQLAELLTTGKS